MYFKHKPIFNINLNGDTIISTSNNNTNNISTISGHKINLNKQSINSVGVTIVEFI